MVRLRPTSKAGQFRSALRLSQEQFECFRADGLAKWQGRASMNRKFRIGFRCAENVQLI
jgi:hypothetical protein